MGLQKIRITKGGISQNVTIVAWNHMEKNVKNHGWSRADGTLPAPAIVSEEILTWKKEHTEKLKKIKELEKVEAAKPEVIIAPEKTVADEITGNPIETDEFDSPETKELAKTLAPKMYEALKTPTKKPAKRKTKKTVKK